MLNLTLNLKSTIWEAVVKSSKIITLLKAFALYISFFSFVYPSIKLLPAVNTGISYSSL